MADRHIAALVPPEFSIPRQAELAGVALRPLGLNDLIPDLEAVLESRDRLIGLFSPVDPWPDGLTLHQDAVDLGWHEKEFQRRTSFAWGLWRGGNYIGSAYLYPDPTGDTEAFAVHWIRTGAATAELTTAFAAAWRDWVTTRWPFARVAFASPEERT